MNRFFDIDGAVATQLAPWVMAKMKWDGKSVRSDLALFRLESLIRFRSDIAGGVIVVPVGLISDLASIPETAWAVFMSPDDPRIALGAWVHDLIYGQQGAVTLEDGTQKLLSRDEADHILAYEAMVDLGAAKFERIAVYEALKCFGLRWPRESAGFTA